MLLFSAGYALFGAFLLLLVLVGGVMGGRPFWEVSPLDVPLALFVVSMVVSALASEFRSVALTSTAYLILVLYLGYGTAYRLVRKDTRTLGTLARAWAAGGAGAALIGAYVFATRPVALQGLGAYTPALGQTALGTTLALGSLISLGEGFAQPRAAGRLLALAAASLCLVGLVLTTSRGAWLGWAVGLTAFALVANSWPSRRPATLAAVVMILLVATAVLAAAPSGLRQSFEAREGSVPSRIHLWTLSLRVIHDHPWFGTGLNTFSRVYRNHLPEGSPYRYENPPFVHNLYLNMTVEGGLAGGLTFLWLVLKAARLGWSHVAHRYDPRATGVFAGYLAVLARELLDGTILSVHLGIGFAILMGILAALPGGRVRPLPAAAGAKIVPLGDPLREPCPAPRRTPREL